MSDASPSIRQQRVELAKQTLIARAKPGTYFYVFLAAFYVPLVIHRPVDLALNLVVLGLFLIIGTGRLMFYRATPRLKLTSDQWRRGFALGAGLTICVWDSFAAFEIWHRSLDASCVILVAASLAFRASGTYTASPDPWVYWIFAGPTRIPIIVAPALTGSEVGYVLSAVLVIHTLYCHFHGKQLHAEFWRAVEATERAHAAHAELQREVELRERTEIELRLAQKLESVGRLAAGIAHEINTPLQAMMGNLEFLKEGVDELLAMAQPTPAQEADLEYLRENLPSAVSVTHEAVERTAAIVRSVKTFAHPEVSKKAPIDINRALQNSLDISRHEYAMVADVETDLAPDLPLVDCYASELNQALLNIVVNGAHAIASRHAETGTRGILRISTRSVGDWVRITIGDTGNGIPEAIRERIFDPFFTTKAVGKGTGQGLAIARTVVAKRHGGELSVESEVGRGTTFAILLPVTCATQHTQQLLRAS